MADWNTLVMQCTLASVPSFSPDGIASFKVKYSAMNSEADYIVATNLSFLIERTITPYMIRENIGKRMVIIGSICPGENTVMPSRIQFVDSFLSGKTVMEERKRKVDFSDE